MKRRAFFSAAGGSLSGYLLSACSHVTHQATIEHAWEPHSRDLEKQIPGLLRETNVPGLSLAVFQRGRIVWQRGFGVKDRESGAPIDTGTLLEAASLSKPVFAYVVLKLCEKGVLDLDTPLTRYTRRRFLEGDSRLDLITTRHVLSHTSGLSPDWRSSNEPLRIAFTPGEKWSYSGEAYYYLQSVVTELTGRTDPNQCAQYEPGLQFCATDFGEYMESRLVTPFGMTSSGYVWKDWFGKQRARPHDVHGNPLPYRKSSSVDLARYGAAGALLTTPGDYAQFLMEVIDPTPPDEFHLNASSLKEMLTPQIEVMKAGEVIISWALGWRIAQTKNRVYLGHDGSNPGFQCISEACAADRSGFVVMTNSDNGVSLLQKLAPEISRRLHF